MSTIAPPAPPPTLRALLLADRPVPELATAPALARVGRLSSAARASVRGRAGTALAGLLEVPLGDALLAGWRRHDDLMAAARATEADPTSSRVVDLADHRVTASYRPRVDLEVDGVPVGHLDAVAEVDFEVSGLSATVARGRVMELRGCGVVVTGRLALEGVPLSSRCVTVDPPLLLWLGAGHPLLDSGPTIVLPRAAST